MDIFQNFQRGYHYLILDQKLATQENQKITKGKQQGTPFENFENFGVF